LAAKITCASSLFKYIELLYVATTDDACIVFEFSQNLLLFLEEIKRRRLISLFVFQ